MKKRRTAKQQAATRKLVALNRSRRRAPAKRRTSTAARKAPAARRRSPAKRKKNPTPAKRRTYSSTATMANPVKRRRRRRNNPAIKFDVASLTNQVVIPGVIGAGGAVAMDILWGYLPETWTNVKTGWGRTIGKAAAAIAVAAVAGQVKPLKQYAAPFAVGAVTVLAYEAARNFMAEKAANVRVDGMGLYVAGLGYYNPATPAGGANAPPANAMGLYVDKGGRPSASHAPASDSLGNYSMEDGYYSGQQ